MRIVHSRMKLEEALKSARAEAEQAFGSGAVYLEKLIDHARSIEVQIVADQHGHCVSLGERESSVQRRRQKIIEEAPSPIVDEELRTRVGEAAVRLAEAAGYTNVGTVEFLLDSKRNFYFLEMNPRLSADHPVTEFVTGLDLVHLQIRIAEGEPLLSRSKTFNFAGMLSSAVSMPKIRKRIFFRRRERSHVFDRLPGRGFVKTAASMKAGRPLEYDPMISKLIAFGSTPIWRLSGCCVRCANTMSAASQPTFVCFAASSAIQIFAQATSTSVIWNHC